MGGLGAEGEGAEVTEGTAAGKADAVVGAEAEGAGASAVTLGAELEAAAAPSAEVPSWSELM